MFLRRESKTQGAEPKVHKPPDSNILRSQGSMRASIVKTLSHTRSSSVSNFSELIENPSEFIPKVEEYDRLQTMLKYHPFQVSVRI